MCALCAPLRKKKKILCRSPFSKRSPVSGLRQTILGKVIYKRVETLVSTSFEFLPGRQDFVRAFASAQPPSGRD